MVGGRVRFTPVTVRSRLMLEVASELVGASEWAYQQVQIGLRGQGAEDWPVTFFASDSPSGIQAVARGEAQMAIINPATVLTVAVRGSEPFPEPLPLRAIAVIPSADQLAFAVKADTNLTSLADIRERRFPLKVSLRGQSDHSVHMVVDSVLAAAGFSLDDITSWGGEVRYDPGLPGVPGRIGAVERGEVHAIFDEAVRGWTGRALDLGMRFLPLEEPLMRRLDGLGYRRAVLAKADYPALPEDVPALDFSGFAMFTHAETPDDVVTGFCAALEARKDRIPTQDQATLPLGRMVRDTPEGPLDVPLHPAAERFWRDQGYLSG
jgi:TRAP-type uncharacterized transport system substrate-binding protein